jgi:hypothetical protein
MLPAGCNVQFLRQALQLTTAFHSLHPASCYNLLLQALQFFATLLISPFFAETPAASSIACFC